MKMTSRAEWAAASVRGLLSLAAVCSGVRCLGWPTATGAAGEGSEVGLESLIPDGTSVDSFVMRGFLPEAHWNMLSLRAY